MKEKRGEVEKNKKKEILIKNRLAEIDDLMIKVFEKNCAGVLSDKMCASLSDKYEQEKTTLEVALQEIKLDILRSESETSSIANEVEKLKQYAEITELNRKIVTALIQSIHISEPRKENGVKVYDIDIRYKFHNNARFKRKRRRLMWNRMNWRRLVMNKEIKIKRFRVATYCRVASANQLDQSALEIQEGKLLDYASEHDYQVICCLKEQGNGLTLDRPQLNIIKCMERGTIDRLLVTNISRIGRNLLDVEDFTQTLKAKGVEVEALDGSHCSSLGFLDDFLKSAYKDASKRKWAKKIPYQKTLTWYLVKHASLSIYPVKKFDSFANCFV